jgi:hypothetical protein
MTPDERRAMIEEAVGTLVFLAALAFAVGVAWVALD